MPEEVFLAVHVGLASLATTRWLCSCPRQVRMARVDSVVGFESMGYGPFVSVDFGAQLWTIISAAFPKKVGMSSGKQMHSLREEDPRWTRGGLAGNGPLLLLHSRYI